MIICNLVLSTLVNLTRQENYLAFWEKCQSLSCIHLEDEINIKCRVFYGVYNINLKSCFKNVTFFVECVTLVCAFGSRFQLWDQFHITWGLFWHNLRREIVHSSCLYSNESLSFPKSSNKLTFKKGILCLWKKGSHLWFST